MTRVLVYSPMRLVCESIMSLLAARQDIEVIACASQMGEVLQHASSREVDVIILGSDETAIGPSPLVLRLWQEGCRAKVIELGLEGRVMSVYELKQVMVTDASELLEAVGPSLDDAINGDLRRI